MIAVLQDLLKFQPLRRLDSICRHMTGKFFFYTSDVIWEYSRRQPVKRLRMDFVDDGWHDDSDRGRTWAGLY